MKTRRGKPTFYVHYEDFNKRLDEWVTEDRLDVSKIELAPHTEVLNKSQQNQSRASNAASVRDIFYVFLICLYQYFLFFYILYLLLSDMFFTLNISN